MAIATAWPPPGRGPAEGGKSFKMFITYIIQSENTGHYYIGMTEDIAKRIFYHNSGKNRSTKNKGPWRLVYSEKFEDKKLAWARERQIKKYKGGEAFKKLLKNNF